MQIQGIQSRAFSTPLVLQSLFHWDPFDANSFKNSPSDPTPVDNDPISLFKDKYGRIAFELTQPSVTSQPLYKVVGGRPYLRYDAVDDVMFTPLVNSDTYFANQEYSLFMVYKNNGVSGNIIRYSNGNAASSMIGISCDASAIVRSFSTSFCQGTSAYTVPKLMTTTRKTDPLGLKIYANGVLENTVSAGAVSSTPYNLNIFVGAFRNSVPYGTAGGDIGEIICFPRVLTAEEQSSIEQYLIKKWAL